MEGQLGWESLLWSNQQHGIEETFVLLSNANTNNAYKMDLTATAEDMMILNPIQELMNPNSRTQASSSLGDHANLTAELCVINRPYSTTTINPLISGLMGDLGMANNQRGLSTTTTTVSLESLDCLLSATNSNTDTAASVEDDGISMIFSADHCTNLWNLGTSGSPISSSGDSDNNNNNNNNKRSNNNPINNIGTSTNNKEMHCLDHHEAVSSDQNLGNGNKFMTAAKPNPPAKRNKVIGASSSDDHQGGFRLISENPPKPKKPRLISSSSSETTNYKCPASSNISFQQPSSSSVSSSVVVGEEPDPEAIAQMKEMIYRAAAFRPVNLGLEVVEKPKRKNVKISSDPQTVAARQRRERISERIRVLQKLVPGGTKMDTASMLDEAANYLKFLRSQVKALENLGHKLDSSCSTTTTSLSFSSSLPFNNNHSFHMQNYSPLVQNPNHHHHHVHHPQS